MSDDTTGLAIRRTQVDEIAVSSRLSRRALIINQTHHRFPCWTNKPMTRLQTLHCAYSVENRLLKKTENSKIKTAKHIQNVKDAAKGQNDYEMSGLLSNATFIDKAVYHSGCIAKVFAHSYLLRVLCSLVGKKDGSLLSVYYQGQMSSDFLQDLICTCKGKAVCSSGCVFWARVVFHRPLSVRNR